MIFYYFVVKMSFHYVKMIIYFIIN